MKHLFLVATLVAAFGSTHLYSQSGDSLAKIPFSFNVGSRQLPPGQYLVRESDGLLSVRNQDGKGGAMHLTLPASRRVSNGNPSLEFTRYGNDYYLTNVWMANSRDGFALIQGSREKELAGRFKTVESAGVLLQPLR